MNKNQEKILKLAKKTDISKISFREIARKLNIENPQTVIYHLGQLKKKGFIYFDPREKKQKLAKVKAFVANSILNIPIVGSANCGPALELAEDDIQGYLKVSKRSISKNTPDGLIVIRAVGNSLNRASIDGESIEEGDYVVVDTKKQPVNGDYVLSIIDGAANFKRFYKNKDKREIKLVSKSTQDMPPIVLHEEDLESSGYLVNGVVIRVIKK